MKFGSIMAATALLTALGGPAHAEMTLRVADSLPANHFFTEQATRYWMSEVGRMTGGEVKFEHYPAQQLGKAADLLSLTLSGAVDIGYVVPSYVSDKLPLTSAAELPGSFDTSCQGTLAFWKLAQEGGLLATEEYEKVGARVLFAVVMPPYQIFLRQPIETVDSFQGRKLRTSSAGQDAIASKLGAVPVRITAPELYDALSRGTVDGMVFPTASALAYDVAGLVKSVTGNENFGTAVLTFMISESKWDSLTPEIQKAMSEAGDAATRRICAYADQAVASDLETIGAQGVEVVTFEAAEHAKMDDAKSEIGKEWAAQLDGLGVPGSKVLKAFQETVK